MLNGFDRKFGEEFISGVPAEPGVYRIYSGSGELIYVGKSRNLRRRLGQYRNAKRRKKHRKMRLIVADADRIEVDSCASHLDAVLLENRLIQLHRPKWNVAGAFHFLYPLIGIHASQGYVYLCWTTRPELFPEFHFHGSFRSREITREGFRALTDLLRFVAAPVARARIFRKDGFGKRCRFSEVQGFRGLPSSWVDQLEMFLRGQSREAIESLVLSLADAPGARRAAKSVQRDLNLLKYFWRHEAVRLNEVRQASGFALYPVPQAERDRLFLEYRDSREARVAGRRRETRQAERTA